MPAITKADVQDRLYDFTEAYYNLNGINPALISGRMQLGPIAVADTPIFSYQWDASDIDDFFKKGYITKTLRPLTDPLHYGICPVIKDPIDGGIALDQFLTITLKADGTPLEPEFLENSESLRLTGEPAN